MKAAQELQDRLDAAVGTAARARMTVSNFHSFCQRILTENAADAGLPPRPDVLDGVAQVLLLKDIAPEPAAHLPLRIDWTFGDFVQFINRAKDELVTPDDFDAFVAEERRVFEERYGSFEAAAARLETQGNLAPLRDVRGAYAGVRANERAEDRGEDPRLRPGRRRQGRRPRGPPHHRRHRPRTSPRPVRTRATTRGSTPSPPPTSSTAPRSRSCG